MKPRHPMDDQLREEALAIWSRMPRVLLVEVLPKLGQLPDCYHLIVDGANGRLVGMPVMFGPGQIRGVP